MKKAIFIIITLFSISSCKLGDKNDSVWTKEYELKLTREIDSETRERLPDDTKRQKFVAFVIKRLKEELPKGVESVPKDSIYKLSIKIGKEYGYNNINEVNTGLKPKLTPWTPLIEQTMREAFLKFATKEDKNEAELLCNCVIAKLKKINPDSVWVPLKHDMAQSVAKDCFFEVDGGNK
jgi:hypothetical protein